MSELCLPVISAEGLGGKTIFVEEIRPRGVAGPFVAYGGRLWDGGAGDKNAIAINNYIGPDEFLVGTAIRMPWLLSL
jgi:hypothetical protein